MRTSLAICLLSVIPCTLTACGGDETSVNSTSSSGGETSSSSGSGSSSSGTVLMPSPGDDKIVINEMNAIGTNEWVEIVNTYDKAVNLEGYAIADSVTMVGGPDVPNALRFPAGASIEPGGYLLAVRNLAAEVPPVKHTGTQCLPNAPADAVCYYMTWEIGNLTGETIYFLAQDDKTLTSADYPANAVDAMAGYKSWARSPDKTGAFAATMTDTPGAANKP